MCYLTIDIKEESGVYFVNCAAQYYSRGYCAWAVNFDRDNLPAVWLKLAELQEKIEAENKNYQDEQNSD